MLANDSLRLHRISYVIPLRDNGVVLTHVGVTCVLRFTKHEDEEDNDDSPKTISFVYI